MKPSLKKRLLNEMLLLDSKYRLYSDIVYFDGYNPVSNSFLLAYPITSMVQRK